VNPKNRTIIITGAVQGLGLCIAETFAHCGAKIALIDLAQSELAKAVDVCQASSDVRYTATDVSNESHLETVFTQIQTDFGSVDVLINEAGIIRDGLLVKSKNGIVKKKMSLQQGQSVIDVNFDGVFLCGCEATVEMIENQSADVIINISSISKASNMDQSNYTSAKSAVTAVAFT
jgi:3-oxoacyl-[acyl-carrier protein] reductase